MVLCCGFLMQWRLRPGAVVLALGSLLRRYETGIPVTHGHTQCNLHGWLCKEPALFGLMLRLQGLPVSQHGKARCGAEQFPI